MASIGDLVANLTVDSTGFTKGLGNAKSSLRSFAGNMGSIVAPVAGAIAGIWGTTESIAAYKEQLNAERKLGAVLETTGHAAGLTAGEIKGLASQLQGVTNFGDEATISAAAVLATFKDIKGDIFTEAIVSAQDMSTVMGGDLQGSVVQLGKALNNPIQGMSALAEVGVSFNEQQKQQITTMQKAGDIAGAQSVILAELQGEFGGAAKAMADPWKQMQNTLGDVGEMFGSLLLPALDVVSGSIGSVMGDVTSFGDTFKSIGIEIGTYLMFLRDLWADIGNAAYDFILPAVSAVGEWFSELFNTVTGGVTSFADLYVEAGAVMKNIGDATALVGARAELAFVQMGNDAAFFFTDQIPALLTWFGDNFTDVMFSTVDYTATIFINLGQNIRNMWSAVLEFIKGNGFEFDWTPLTEGAVSAIDKLPELPQRISTEFETSLSNDIAGMSQALSTNLADTRAELSTAWDGNRASLASRYDTSTIKSDVTEIETGKGTGKRTSSSGSSQAAFAGSREALQIAMRGVGKNPVVDLTKELVKLSQKQLALQERQAEPTIETSGSLVKI